MLKILNKYGVNSYENINSEKSAEVFELFKDLYQKTLFLKKALHKPTVRLWKIHV